MMHQGVHYVSKVWRCDGDCLAGSEVDFLNSILLMPFALKISNIFSFSGLEAFLYTIWNKYVAIALVSRDKVFKKRELFLWDKDFENLA